MDLFDNFQNKKINLGVHFPSDILGGICWGFIVSMFVFRLLKIKLNETI